MIYISGKVIEVCPENLAKIFHRAIQKGAFPLMEINVQ